MYWHDIDGWDWLWGMLMMSFWLVLIGCVVYITVKLAQGGHAKKL